MSMYLPTAEELEARDAKIKRYLQCALDYMNTEDPAKGPIANMYAEWIVETFNQAKKESTQ